MITRGGEEEDVEVEVEETGDEIESDGPQDDTEATEEERDEPLVEIMTGEVKTRESKDIVEAFKN